VASDNPTLEELGISGRAAAALKAAGLETRSQLEAFGLDRIEEVKGIGSDYADEIRTKVAASYDEQPQSGESVDESPQVDDPPSKASEVSRFDKERLERATLTLAAGLLAAVGPVPSPPFHQDVNLARRAKVLAKAMLEEIDRGDPE